ncbi:protein [Escherichia coli]|uniref:Protein n=1 Tax=Escherichia coli TaxID=562 RepID=A0A376P4G6_ECOLX|nr:protein [Escherichia coli]
MAEHRGGSGNFAEDREKASDAGRKGVSIAAVILKMIRNAHLKRVKKAVNKAVVINQVNPDSPLIINIS